MMKVKSALEQGYTLLFKHSPSPQLDAQILLSHALKKNKAFLFTHPQALLSNSEWEQYKHFLDFRAQGIPVAYLTGQQDFWSLTLNVSPATLIPRPETELMVELTLTLLKHVKQTSLLELGTGCGAIALALAVEKPTWQITACDNSQDALAIAKENQIRLNLSKVTFKLSHWFSAFTGQRFNAILANPPYIAQHDPHLPALRHEPQQALISGPEGLDDLTCIIAQSPAYLLPGGLLMLEHGFDQASAVATLMKQAGFKNIQCWRDLQGLERTTTGNIE